MEATDFTAPAHLAARTAIRVAWGAHRVAIDTVRVSDSPTPRSIDMAARAVTGARTLVENTLASVPGTADNYTARCAVGILTDAADMLSPRNVQLLTIAHNAAEACAIAQRVEERLTLADIAYEARDLVRNPRGNPRHADAAHARIVRRAREYDLTGEPATAGEVLRTALTAHGITAGRDIACLTVPLDGTDLHIALSDSAPTVEHAPGEHTGWLAWLLGSNGEPLAEVYDGTADGTPVDCAADSAAAAAAVADFLAARR
jgi:hypothetical protein